MSPQIYVCSVQQPGTNWLLPPDSLYIYHIIYRVPWLIAGGHLYTPYHGHWSAGKLYPASSNWDIADVLYIFRLWRMIFRGGHLPLSILINNRGHECRQGTKFRQNLCHIYIILPWDGNRPLIFSIILTWYISYRIYNRDNAVRNVTIRRTQLNIGVCCKC